MGNLSIRYLFQEPVGNRTPIPHRHRLDEFPAQVFLGELLSSRARLRFPGVNIFCLTCGAKCYKITSNGEVSSFPVSHLVGSPQNPRSSVFIGGQYLFVPCKTNTSQNYYRPPMNTDERGYGAGFDLSSYFVDTTQRIFCPLIQCSQA